MSYRKLFISLAVALSFSGCGGSGGGGAAGGGQPFGSDSAVLRNADSAAVAAAAGNAPNSGSVTQSSNGNGDQTNPTTTDVATATVGVDASTGELQWEWERVSGTSTVLVSGESASNIESIGLEEDGGRLWVDVYTDFARVTFTSPTQMVPGGSSGGSPVLVTVGGSLRTTGGFISPNLTLRAGGSLGDIPGIYNGEIGHFECAANCVLTTSNNVATSEIRNIMFIPASSTTVTTPDAAATTTTTYPDDPDYLVGGIWVYAPDGASGPEDYEFGAFADGNDPFTAANLAGLTGTATYRGDEDVIGVYTDNTTDTNSFFGADVSLTAEFGDASALGTISGTISGFFEEDGESLSIPDLTLGSAAIEDGNFFTGDTTGGDFTGKWGGQFYGNGSAAADHPGSAAGTFGGATQEGDKAFLGTFGAERQ